MRNVPVFLRRTLLDLDNDVFAIELILLELFGPNACWGLVAGGFDSNYTREVIVRNGYHDCNTFYQKKAIKISYLHFEKLTHL